MRIGFDGKRAVQNFTGLGNYSRHVIEMLCRFYPENEYILYAPKARQSKPFDAMLRQAPELKQVHAEGAWQKMGAVWRSWGLSARLEKDRVDIYHGLSNELPLNIRKSGVKSVVTLHDLIFLRYPKYYKAVDRRIYAFKFRKACEDADAIVAISECTKRDIMRFFQIPEKKIHVVYQGCDASFACPVPSEKKAAVCRKYSLPGRYILNVGSIEERKNALRVVQALRDIPEDVHAVLVGRPTPYTRQVKAYCAAQKLEKRVHLLHGIAFDELPAIYRMAKAFVYPSYYEGFGIPIIEALHSGVPVIAAKGSCLEEAGGPDSIYVNPDIAGEISAAVNHILENPELREGMAQAGKAYVQRFSDERQARQLMRIYQSLTNKKE